MLGKLAFARYRFVLQATSPLWLNAFAGATLRGGFGHVFKRTVCIWPPGDCSRCLLKNTCSYPYIFETAPPPGSEKLRGLEQIPRPFVIEPPDASRRLFEPGKRLEFRLVLIGRAMDYLPYFLLTFSELGRTGLGAERGRFRVVEVHTETRNSSRQIYAGSEGVLHAGGERIIAQELESGPVGSRLAVHFLTPTRIQSDGAIRTQVSFQDLCRALLRRLSSLCYFHCGGELLVDFKGLIEQASAIRTVRSDVEWQQQDRFSERQRQRIEMGGVVGRVVFEAAEVERWEVLLPLLGAGVWVHVGKGAVMGLGKYRVEEV